jgi:acyl-CoA reductase-like NAD-dependent aldehyde dehydrogenase
LFCADIITTDDLGPKPTSTHPLNVLNNAGSKRIAEMLATNLRGKVFLEDAGFDWKILGPDVSDVDYVAWQCDQDAYACSGQKCSAQSILFMHENWKPSGLLEKFRARAAARKLEDLTVGPVLTVSTKKMLDHTQRLLQIPGAYDRCKASFFQCSPVFCRGFGPRKDALCPL